MPGEIPYRILLYRMVHIDNVEHILKHGICIKSHKSADPKYINIGDTGLIANRNGHKVKIMPPGGSLGDYVPFYLGPLSPMLLKIQNGTGGVTKRPPQDIIYLLCDIDLVIGACPDWCFADGHAKNAISEFYNNKQDLDKIDWNIVGEKYWRDTEEDFDRMRRKQAEFLVKTFVPVSCIIGIATFDQNTESVVDAIVKKSGLQIPVRTKRNFYY